MSTAAAKKGAGRGKKAAKEIEEVEKTETEALDVAEEKGNKKPTPKRKVPAKEEEEKETSASPPKKGRKGEKKNIENGEAPTRTLRTRKEVVYTEKDDKSSKKGKAKTAGDSEDSKKAPAKKGRGGGKTVAVIKPNIKKDAAKKKKDNKNHSYIEIIDSEEDAPSVENNIKISTLKRKSIASRENSVEPTSKVSKRKPKVVVPSSDQSERTSKSKSREPSVEIPNKKKTNKKTKTENSVEKIDDAKVNKKRGGKDVTAEKPKVNKISSDYTTINFESESGKDWNLKISSWNIAGLRAWLNKDGLSYVEHEKPDIICLQETKCPEEEMLEIVKLPSYHPYYLAKSSGYAGVAIYSKIMPMNIEYGIGDPEQDEDGRIITAEYEKFFLICVYVPNSSRKLVNLDKRMRWDKLFQSYIKKLDNKKPVIICGDMNVAHQEIDLANPKTNKRNAGFTQEERDGFSDLLSLGLIDTYRHLHPNKEKAYTFWTYMANARSKNVGWRLDYFIVSERIIKRVVDNVMRTEVFGSDHCPITLFLKN